MTTTNDAMVELCQQLKETNQDQGKQIRKTHLTDRSTHQAPSI